MADEAIIGNADQLRAVLAAAGASGAWDWDIVRDRLTVDARFAELYGLGADAADQPESELSGGDAADAADAADASSGESRGKTTKFLGRITAILSG